ncbi:hypothetical protein PTW37_08365 [Arthrobacter agilis]|uniref:hypothetical protein n=1 Tax=Arthrobacter agilis TaxID=37921 RepID=UPI00236720CB|nr:hypothetical protein [Arthrobacter agilis]WDF31912.1 hypothetical protein PTW37_08365 [Arthrobacter agilis]
MGDLQCPATAILLPEDGVLPSWLDRFRVAGRFSAPHDAGVLIDEKSDEYRGEAFVVLAPMADLVLVLRSRGLPGDLPAVVEIDADGWRPVDRPGAPTA